MAIKTSKEKPAKLPTKKKWGHEEKQDFRASEGGSPGKNWIAGAIKKPGALRKSLGVKAGNDIPQSKLNKAAKSSNPTTKKRAVLAKTLAGFHK